MSSESAKRAFELILQHTTAALDDTIWQRRAVPISGLCKCYICSLEVGVIASEILPLTKVCADRFRYGSYRQAWKDLIGVFHTYVAKADVSATLQPLAQNTVSKGQLLIWGNSW